MLEKEKNDVINTEELTDSKKAFDAQSVFGDVEISDKNNTDEVGEADDTANEMYDSDDEDDDINESFTYQPTRWERIKDAIKGLRSVCCFTTLLSSLGFILLWSRPENVVLQVICIVSILLGFLSTLLSCPLRLILCGCMIIVKGFTIGLAFLGVGCIVGMCLGMFLAVGLVFCFPAVYTIYFYFTELSLE